ncbi:Hpt domain-containing protein [Flavivirga spongiicola]|uniref:Hpt domain-containing protein n=1 Tax=Flavivirga spongiicola TaxID=421621 RepID=A0ABU7XUN7_9FLAO|nr:Hpt domain-containing protein [Flavivirga sp. MEBiC05379]MDO5978557.1 Hpt domain-containing protein [Flavivirga sp. MEBiC05379]
MIKSNYQYIDLDILKENAFDDVSIVKEIMELFIELIDEYVEVLNSQFPNKNWQLLFQATHKIKPNISMFGISKLEPAILQLESAFKNEQNIDTTGALVNDCLAVFKEVEREIQTELRSMTND